MKHLKLLHFRCRKCGADYYTPPKEYGKEIIGIEFCMICLADNKKRKVYPIENETTK